MNLIDITALKHRLELIGEDGAPTTDPKEDTFLGTCVDQANAIVSGIVGRDVTEQTWTEYASGLGGHYLELRQGPLVTLTSVDQVQRTSTGDSLTSQNLNLIFPKGQRDEGWKMPVALYRSIPWEAGEYNYKIVYDAGFTTIPKELVDAALFAAVAIRNTRKDAGTKSRDIGAGGRSFRSQLEIRSDVKSMVRDFVDERTPQR